MPNVKAIYGDKLIYCDRPYGALEGADGLAIVTEWQEFRNPDFEVMRRLLREHGDLRRPQSLRAEDSGELRLHLLLHRPHADHRGEIAPAAKREKRTIVDIRNLPCSLFRFRCPFFRLSHTRTATPKRPASRASPPTLRLGHRTQHSRPSGGTASAAPPAHPATRYRRVTALLRCAPALPGHGQQTGRPGRRTCSNSSCVAWMSASAAGRRITGNVMCRPRTGPGLCATVCRHR